MQTQEQTFREFSFPESSSASPETANPNLDQEEIQRRQKAAEEARLLVRKQKREEQEVSQITFWKVDVSGT